MAVFVFIAAFLALAFGQDISSLEQLMIKYYRELGCTPIYQWEPYLPLHYDCRAVQSARKFMCHVNGMFFKNGETLDGPSVDLPCRFCTCSVKRRKSSWTCAVYDCFWWPTYEENCHFIYTRDNCCPQGVLCPNSTIPDGTRTCEYDGHIYFEGHVMNIPGEPCMSCVCQQTDDVSAYPTCQNVVCGFELDYALQIQQGCAMVYYGQYGCCPIDTRCPKSTDYVIRDWYPYSYPQCVFGRLRLNMYDILSSGDDPCVHCKCIVPPHVTCWRTPDCEP